MDPDQNFKQLIRLLYQYIRAHHHLLHVQISTGNTVEPRSLKTTMRWLENLIKPANPNTLTDTLLYGNARNWLHTSLQILEEHYQGVIRDIVLKINSMDLNRWKEAWQIAIKWSRRNLRHIQNSTIHWATLEISEHMRTTENLSNSSSQTNLDTTQLPYQNPNPTTTLTQGDNIGFEQEQAQTQMGTITTQSTQRATMETSVLHKTTEHNIGIPGYRTPDLTPKTNMTLPSLEISRPTTIMAQGVYTSPSPRPGQARIHDDTTTPLTTDPHPRVAQSPMTKRNPACKRKLQGEDNLSVTLHDIMKALTDLEEPSTSNLNDQHVVKKIPRINMLPFKKPSPGGESHENTSQPRREETSRTTCHPHHGDKYGNWKLQPVRPILIMGDSNIARLPEIKNNIVQVDSYPGAQLAHAYHILKHHTPTTDDTQKVILSFGLNNRNQNNPSLIKKQLQRLLGTAQDTFPNAEIYIPIINFSSNLPNQIRRNLNTINNIIETTGRSIPPLPRSAFTTAKDEIHWTAVTANNICQHWLARLNWH